MVDDYVRDNGQHNAEYALEAEAKFTPGLRVREVLEHGDELAVALRKRCEQRSRVGNSTVIGIVLSVADVMFLADAYREARALIDGTGASKGRT